MSPSLEPGRFGYRARPLSWSVTGHAAEWVRRRVREQPALEVIAVPWPATGGGRDEPQAGGLVVIVCVTDSRKPLRP